MTQIYPQLYQFSQYIPPIDFSIHQYLLASDPAILFAAGTAQQAEAILPEIREILGGRPLKYLFVSHLESDECGGLPVFRQAYPALTVLCSPLAARELPGFGQPGPVQVGDPGVPLVDGDLRLRFFPYPAEVHLQDGLVCLEENRGIFYSSDLMQRPGNGSGRCLPAQWVQEVEAIGPDRIPNEDRRAALQQALRPLRPAFVAVGHGFCLTCGEG